MDEPNLDVIGCLDPGIQNGIGNAGGVSKKKIVHTVSQCKVINIFTTDRK